MQPIKYNHMMDLAFSIETEADEEAIFNKENMPALLARARARLDEIEREGCTEAFGLCDTYENPECTTSKGNVMTMKNTEEVLYLTEELRAIQAQLAFLMENESLQKKIIKNLLLSVECNNNSTVVLSEAMEKLINILKRENEVE